MHTCTGATCVVNTVNKVARNSPRLPLTPTSARFKASRVGDSDGAGGIGGRVGGGGRARTDIRESLRQRNIAHVVDAFADSRWEGKDGLEVKRAKGEFLAFVKD